MQFLVEIVEFHLNLIVFHLLYVWLLTDLFTSHHTEIKWAQWGFVHYRLPDLKFIQLWEWKWHNDVCLHAHQICHMSCFVAQVFSRELKSEPAFQPSLHIQIPPICCVVSYYAIPLWLLQARVPLRVLRGYSNNGTMTEATAHPVAAEYPNNSLKGTATCRSHIGSALYETHVASWEKSWCVTQDNQWCHVHPK